MLELSQLWPVLVASVASFLGGWLWYSPMLFAKPWIEAMGKNEADMQNMSKDQMRTMAYGFISTVITAYSLAVLFLLVEPTTLWQAIQVSLFACFGFVVVTKFTGLIYESNEPHWSKRPQFLFLIGSGYQILSFTLITLVLWYFR